MKSESHPTAVPERHLHKLRSYATATSVLEAVQGKRLVIQDACPAASCIEWELSRLFYERGWSCFKAGGVPYEVNNNGNLSLDAAHLLFSGWMAEEPTQRTDRPVYALEIGPGTGLFARYFLDEFQRLCEQHAKPFYDHLCLVLADISHSMLNDIQDSGILSPHEGHYHLIAFKTGEFSKDLINITESASSQSVSFRAVFLNYVLDSLPATILKISDLEVKELYVKTYLRQEADLTRHTRLQPEEIVRKARSGSSEEKRDLVDLYPFFVLECSYQSADMRNIPHSEFAVHFGKKNGHHVIHNFVALTYLEQCARLLESNGLILINDYGITDAEDHEHCYVHQKFSGATAISVNFPLLQEFVQSIMGLEWIEPDGENDQIVTRLITSSGDQRMTDQFRSLFGKEKQQRRRESVCMAYDHMRNSRNQNALDAFEGAVSLQPRNWVLLGEIAKFLLFTIRDYEAAADMAQAALSLNSIGSADLWNTLGDAMMCLNQVESAKDAFLTALDVDNRDVRARYNLVFVCCYYKDYENALKIVGEALALDKQGAFQQQLLDKQTEILGAMRQRSQDRERCIHDRISWKVQG